MMRYTLNTLLILLCLSTSAHATEGWSMGDISEDSTDLNAIVNDPNSGYRLRTTQHFMDDIFPWQKKDDKPLTEEEQHEAARWGLTHAEERRYLQLMENRSGTYYQGKNMTPVEVLGFNARNDEERQRYADVQAAQMVERASRERAFGAAVQRSMNTLYQASGYPVVRPYDHQKYSPHNQQALQLNTGDTLVFFAKTTDEVKPVTSELITLLTKTANTQLNIFLVDADLTTEKANKWARTQSIPVSLVKDKKITLNLGEGQWHQISPKGETPTLVLIRKGESQIVNVGKF